MQLHFHEHHGVSDLSIGKKYGNAVRLSEETYALYTDCILIIFCNSCSTIGAKTYL